MCREPAPALNYGLRLAVAVTLGLVVEIGRGAILPPLAPVIALQLLALPGPAPGGKQVAGLLAVVAGASLLAYAVATLTVNIWLLYAMGTGLLYLWGFWLAVRPATAAAGSMFLTMSVVVTAISALSTGAAIFLVVELLGSVVLGIALVFLVHAAFPHRAAAGPARPAGPAVLPAMRAALATLVILPLHLALTAQGAAAFVVLLTVATMLRQPGVADSLAYGTRFALGNLLGGVLAAAIVTLAKLHQSPAVLASLIAAGALAIAWRITHRPDRAGVLVPGFVAYTLLVGLAFAASTLKSAGDVAYLTRVAQIVAASLYALAGISLCLPLLARRPPRESTGQGASAR